jgi:uncharacterized protein (TIGR02301 family)
MRIPGLTNRSAKGAVPLLLVAAALLCGVPREVRAQAGLPDSRPYDEKLVQLSEILGAMHFLRELCGSGDGMLWRDRMRELMDADGSSALRRARLTRSFNNGYRNYSRTYTACTPSAQMAISRFLKGGADIADGLSKANR